MRLRLTAVVCLAAFNAHANVIQYVTGISYSNPAELFKVQHNDFIIGGTGFYTNGRFKGSALDFNTFKYVSGVSNTHTVSLLPYGRIATRVTDQLVFGVDVTQPIHSNLRWGDDNIARFASTDNLATDIDISPRFSLAVNKKLYIGAGMNFNFLHNNAGNWSMPLTQTKYAKLINNTAGFGIGYNAGLYYTFGQSNFLGIAYFSYITQDSRGTSVFANHINNDVNFKFHLPATQTFNFVHIMSPTWLISVQALRAQWSANQLLSFKNTAVPPPLPADFVFPMKFKDAWAYNAALRHQLNDKSGLTLIGLIDYGPEKSELRTINFPCDTQYLLALALDHHFNKTTSVELLVGEGFSKSIISKQIDLNGQNMTLTTGRIRFNANVVDLKLKIQA